MEHKQQSDKHSIDMLNDEFSKIYDIIIKESVENADYVEIIEPVKLKFTDYLKWSNIKAYITGTFRKWVINTYKKHFGYIDEVVAYRTVEVYEKSPKCLTSGACVKCGCPTPDLFYADKACKGNCYNPMSTLDDWTVMKNRNIINLTDINNKLNEINNV